MFNEALRQAATDLAREMGYKPVNKKKPRKVFTVKRKLVAWVQSVLKQSGMTKPR